MGRIDKFMMEFFKKLFVSEKKEKQIPVEKKKNVVVICFNCGWEGTVEESMKNDSVDDSCPDCGCKILSYDVSTEEE
jgi:DNA-directed RNA polymerase subunit RPC12/RpoP